VTLVPYIAAAGELKTKPTQHSVRELTLARHPARHPALPLRASAARERARQDRAVLQRPQGSGDPRARRAEEHLRVPRNIMPRGSTRKCCAPSASSRGAPDLTRWSDIMDRSTNPEGEVTIGVVGKYVGLPDAYKSLNEALVHGGIANRVKVNIQWLDAELFEQPDTDIAAELEPLHAILVPGGFGERGSEGKIASVRFARERRNALSSASASACRWPASRARGTSPASPNASSTEFGADRGAGRRPDHRMDERGRACRSAKPGGDLGGTMRLGAYPAKLDGNSHVAHHLRRHRRSASGTATATRSTSTTRTRWSRAAWSSRACRPTARCCRRSSSGRTIPGSSACSSIPS
jgi:CTP synthase